MPKIEELINFLYDKKVLDTEPSPWPSVREDEIVYPIDYNILFGKRKRREESNESFMMLNDFSHLKNDPLFEDDIEDPWDGMDSSFDEADFGDFRNQIGKGYEPGDVDPSGGMDICAWYQPVHFHGYDWGTYIRENCIIRQRNLIASCLPFHYINLPPQITRILYRACYRASFAIYLLHEQFHHRTESLGIRLHVTQGSDCYLRYFKNVYQVLKGTDNHLEEALANAYIFRRITKDPYKKWLGTGVLEATLKFLELSIPLHPPGYRKTLDYKTQATFDRGENLLQCQINEASANPTQTPREWDLAPNMTESLFPWKTTLYTVLPASAPHSRIWPRMQPAPTCSTNLLIKLCQNQGWSIVSGGKGSHVKLKKHGATRPIIIPGNRKQLAPGTLNSILKALNIGNIHELPEMLDAL